MRLLILLLLLVGCSSEVVVEPKPTEPVIVNPTIKPKPAHCLYIRAKDGKPLEPKVSLTRKQYCNLQLQGTGFVDGKLYGYHTKNNLHKTDCSDISSKISGTVKFLVDKNKYGTGVKNWPITPFKSIAVDPRYIPYGSTVYIPALKGARYEFEGKQHVHDGYVKAEDTGGAIKGRHIDFFIGPHEGTWSDRYKFVAKRFPFVKSKSSAKFDAYVKGKRLRLWSTFYYLPVYRSCNG